MFKQDLVQSLKVIILALVIAVGTSYVSAVWNAPSATPPNGNTDAPINVGYNGQIKQGNLWIKGLADATTSAVNGLIVENGNVGIGTTTPSVKLEVGGQVKITGGNPGVDKILASDEDGLASWKSASDLGISSGSTAGTAGTAGTSTSDASNVFISKAISYSTRSGVSNSSYQGPVLSLGVRNFCALLYHGHGDSLDKGGNYTNRAYCSVSRNASTSEWSLAAKATTGWITCQAICF